MGLADVAVSAEPTTEPVDLVHPCSSVAELHHKGFSPLPWPSSPAPAKFSPLVFWTLKRRERRAPLAPNSRQSQAQGSQGNFPLIYV